MNFSTSSIMPLLARLVIAAAMLTSGWMNCFEQVQVRPAIVEGLQLLDIEVREQSATLQASGDDQDQSVPLQERTSFTTRGVNRIVWLISERWPELGTWGIVFAWTAAVGQLLAGILLILGLFTRLAALVVCVATGMAVYMVSGTVHGMFSMNPFEWPQDTHRFIQLFAGLGLFTLSLGLLLGGGGMIALDQRGAKSAPVKKRSRGINRVEPDV